jgi:hypothetical protein
MTTASAFTPPHRLLHSDPIRRASSRTDGLSRWAYLAGLTCVLLAALGLQLGLFGIGFYRVSFDESARSLMALSLSGTNALEPYIWPPFYKLFVGSFLKLWGEVFLVPRLLAGAAGLLTILALVRLSDLLFGDRRVNLLTALLAVAFPHRLIFSVAPLSDIYAYLFLLLAAGCVLAWLRLRSVPQLLLGCACLLLAQTVRFEVGAFAAVLFPLILHRWLVRRELGFGAVAAAAMLLFAFPAFWVIDTWFWYGSLEGLGFTGKQYADALGTSRLRALYLSPIGRNLGLDVLWNPLILGGLAVLAWTAARDAAVRAWTLAFGAPLLLITATMVLTFSIPMAAPWRTTGPWALLLLPFEALAIVWFVARLGRGQPTRSAVATAALLGLALLPPAARSAVYVRGGMLDLQTGAWREDREAGLHVVRELGGSDGQALLDSAGNLEFLDVLAGSGAPGRFVLSHGTNALAVASYTPSQGPPPADRFDLARGGSAEALAAERVRLLLVRNPQFLDVLDGSQRWRRARSFGAWVLFRPRAAEARPSIAGVSGAR